MYCIWDPRGPETARTLRAALPLPLTINATTHVVGPVDWTSGLDQWTGPVDWTGGLVDSLKSFVNPLLACMNSDSVA